MLFKQFYQSNIQWGNHNSKLSTCVNINNNNKHNLIPIDLNNHDSQNNNYEIHR